MSGHSVSQVSRAQFAEAVLQTSANMPVLVDFWAEWCGPCKSLAPIVEQLAQKYIGKLAVVKVDTDAEQELASQFGIRSLPTLMLFRDGQAVAQVAGAQPLAALEDFIAPWLPRETDPLIENARQAQASGDSDTAISTLETALALDPSDHRIHPILGELYAETERYDDARALLAALPANVAIDSAFDTLKARLNMAEIAAPADGSDDPVSEVFSAAVQQANSGDYDAGVSALLGLLPAQREWRDGAVPQTLVDIFKLLGDDPRVRSWRRQMSRSLN